LPTEDRARALIAGLPAYVRRLRAIEDLEEKIVAELVREGEVAMRGGLDAEAGMRASFPTRWLDKLNDLIERHNRYYPVEANLPMRLCTGEWVDRGGAPWKARAPMMNDELIARAVQQFSGG
jgi:hypothetical protein